MARPRLQRRLLGACLGVLICAVGPAGVVLEERLAADAQEEVRRDLEQQARLLGAELLRAPPASLPAWVQGLAPHLEARVTAIALSGQVLADTQVAPEALARLENHADRPEVAAARAGHTGVHRRRSATLAQDMLYVAVPVGQPPQLVLRMALPLDRVRLAARRAQGALLLSGLLALALAAGTGLVLARLLVRPVVALTEAARAMTRGDFSAELPPASRDELGELVQALRELRRQMAAHLGELQAEGEKLRAVLDGMTEGVALVRGGHIALANPAFGQLVGRARVEGLRPAEIEELPELAEAVESAALRRTPVKKEVAAGPRTLELQVQPLGDPSGQQAVVLLLDVTEAKRLERVRRDFVANASHELRTPVAAIIGAAETLAAGAATDPQACASFVRILNRHAQRLSRLTSDLLDLSRLEAGYRPRLEAVPVQAALAAVLPALRARAEERRIALVDELPPDLPEVAAERAAVEQILTNLIDNAIKFTPEGGEVRISAVASDGRLRITVADTGPGIPAEHLPRLFERFYRVDSARSRELGGTGLGLAIVRHLALACGGEVSVQSELGRGSRFHVTLPRAA
ncbi:MAG: ATP-binding protein [Myxococcales bacterium]|nr:ATP-binding protein [Myxococcota bacterium]MDW8282092.1 ATP-binding protein [Myxococcales bacterium]